MRLTRLAQVFSNADALTDVFLRNVEDYSLLLEAHIRGCLRAGRQEDLSADLQAIASVVEPAALTSSMQQSSNAGGGSSSARPKNALAAPQLHALLVTSIKAAAAAVAADGAAAHEGDRRAAPLFAKVMTCCALGSGASVSSGGDTVPCWAMLLARCLVTAAREAQRLQQHMLGGPAGSAWADPAKRSSLACQMSELAIACSRAVQYMQMQVPLMARTTRAAAAGSLLQQQQDRLSQQVDKLQAAAAGVMYQRSQAGRALRPAAGPRAAAAAATDLAAQPLAQVLNATDEPEQLWRQLEQLCQQSGELVKAAADTITRDTTGTVDPPRSLQQSQKQSQQRQTPHQSHRSRGQR